MDCSSLLSEEKCLQVFSNIFFQLTEFFKIFIWTAHMRFRKMDSGFHQSEWFDILPSLPLPSLHSSWRSQDENLSLVTRPPPPCYQLTAPRCPNSLLPGAKSPWPGVTVIKALQISSLNTIKSISNFICSLEQILEPRRSVTLVDNVRKNTYKI